MGLALLARHPVVEPGREHLINIWLSGRAALRVYPRNAPVK